MSVKVCGALVSSLFYENSNHSGDNEGLLLGKVTNHVVDTISDSQISNIKEKTDISVYAFLRCDSGLSWYDNMGRVDMEKLRALLPNGTHKDVIGWFKFRRNSSLSISLRERAVHKNLLAHLPGRHGDHFVFLLCCADEDVIGWFKFRRNTSLSISLRERAVHKNLLAHLPGRHGDHFVFLLCCTDEVRSQTTHALSHVFYTLGDSGLKPLSAEILNLGDTMHNEYKLPAASGPDGGGAHVNPLQQTIQSMRKEFMASDGQMRSVGSINHLTTTVQSQLQSLCSGVARSEDALGKLRSEIKELQQSLDRKRALEEGRKAAATIKTNLIATAANAVAKDASKTTTNQTRSDTALDKPPLSPRQRFSTGSDVSPRPRRMSSLSEAEYSSRQYDLMETTSESGNYGNYGGNQGNVELPMATEEVKVENLISFDEDEEQDNARNLAIDAAAATANTQKKKNTFEDNFADFGNVANPAPVTKHGNVPNPVTVTKPKVLPPITKSNTNELAPVMTPQAISKTLQQMAKERDRGNQAQPRQNTNQAKARQSNKVEQMESDKDMNADPFGFIADVQKAELNKATLTKPKKVPTKSHHVASNPIAQTVQNTMQQQAHQSDLNRATRAAAFRGQPKGQGQIKGQPQTGQGHNPNSPREPQENSEDSQGSGLSDSPLF